VRRYHYFSSQLQQNRVPFSSHQNPTTSPIYGSALNYGAWPSTIVGVGNDILYITVPYLIVVFTLVRSLMCS